jgi:hypothetical protein
MGYFPFVMMFFLALMFTQHHYNSKAGKSEAEHAHLMPRCLNTIVLMLGTKTAYVYCEFS